MERLVEHAKTQGVERVYSVDFADDPYLTPLSKKLHMNRIRDPNDMHQVIHTLHL